MLREINDKLILTDCDGVLLDWEYHFYKWLKETEGYERLGPEYNIAKAIGVAQKTGARYVNLFNRSEEMKKLSPLRDAIKYVKKLHEDHGYVFRVVSSLSNDYYAQHLRTKNLREMFGDSVFEKYIYLDTGADKDEALEPYRDSGYLWVEDKIENADLGLELGLNSVLIQHEHNKNYRGNAIKVANWREIYELIL